MPQDLVHQSVRNATGTAHSYIGDWHALFDLLSIPTGTWEGRMIQYVNMKLGTSITDVTSALQALATSQGVGTFGELGTFDASVS